MASDFFLDPAEDPRMIDQMPWRGEPAVDVGYLEFYRTTFELKCQGLDAEQLARRSVPPSTMSLLGLLRHLAGVEHSWNRRALQGQVDLPRLDINWRPDDPDWDFHGAVATAECVDEAWAVWRAEVADARAWLVTEDFDRIVDVRGEPTEVRDIVVHLIEEYARHCGHADLLRECIDGRVGQ